MPLLPRGLAFGRLLRLIKALAPGLVFVLVAAACASTGSTSPDQAGPPSSEPGPSSTVSEPTIDAGSNDPEIGLDGGVEAGVSERSVAWWFESPCSLDDICLPSAGEAGPPYDILTTADDDLQVVVDDAPEGSVIELAPGSYPSISITTPGLTLRGPAECCGDIPSIRIEAADTVVVQLVIETIVVSPPGNRTRLIDSRIGHVFVNGADDVVIAGNVMRPAEPGPDVIQVKEFDEDPPVRLLIEGNVLGPQDSFESSHTDCIQILGGDDIVISRNIILPCGDKALQIRSGAGGTVGSVELEANFIYECQVRREGCNGFHAIVWASTNDGQLTLRHNTILGSLGVSESGSTISPGDNFTAIGNIAASLPCTSASVDNVTVAESDCGGGNEFPAFVDSGDAVGDLRLVDPESVPPASAAFGPGIDSRPSCAAPRVGAATYCGAAPSS